jgi:hypothetical protein
MLKLVSVEGEPIPDVSLAEELREFADGLETDDDDSVGVVSLVLNSRGEIRVCWFGNDYSHYELMGLFEAAKFRVLADDAIADD